MKPFHYLFKYPPVWCRSSMEVAVEDTSCTDMCVAWSPAFLFHVIVWLRSGTGLCLLYIREQWLTSEQ